ncbi:hypothetical protein MKX03_034039 [Papaver bracteatum]|nr:hypothetical protein MKX03_034039 [Papaver bracteatum]
MHISHSIVSFTIQGFSSFQTRFSEFYCSLQIFICSRLQALAYKYKYIMMNKIPDSVIEMKLRLSGSGMQKIFKQTFRVEEGEKLLKASRCYLSTTAGPIAGLLFVSTLKIAFCSEKSLTISSTNGGLIRTPYKVVIPIEKIKRVEESQNINKPKRKYIEIVTVDHFDFWFMGFVNYDKAFKTLQKSINTSQQQQSQ